MPEPSNIFLLAMFTLTCALIFGIVQLRRAKKAKRSGERSTFESR